MNEQQIEEFLHVGAQFLTNLHAGIRQLREWTEAFEARGGAEVFGKDAMMIVEISKKIQQQIDATDLAIVARLRTDI